jgi:hypothetical protein
MDGKFFFSFAKKGRLRLSTAFFWAELVHLDRMSFASVVRSSSLLYITTTSSHVLTHQPFSHC